MQWEEILVGSGPGSIRRTQVSAISSYGKIRKSLSHALYRHKGALWASVGATLVVSIMSMVVQSYIRDLSQQDAAKALTTVAETTEEALVTWFEREKEKARIYADRIEIVSFTKRLLEVKRLGQDLLSSSAQAEQRDWLASDLAASKHLGFFLVAPDGTNIGSARDANVGKVNFLSNHSDFLSRILDGETLMSLPVRSDIPLADENGVLSIGVPTMFVGAPVHDETSAIIAILLFRINPQYEFMRIMKRGRIGSSGETYAFDRNGKLLSVSRFFGQLLAVGLLNQEASDSLGIGIRDPGVNLVEGREMQERREDQPLTLMAQEATAGKNGQNLVGYRDYRGVPVIGVWRWIEELDLGITSEIDVDEVYELSGNYMAMIRLATAVIVVMSISILMISSYTRGRVVAGHTRYRNLFNETNDAIIVADAMTGEIVDANEQALRDFRYSREEVLGMKIKDLHPGSEGDVFRDKLSQIQTDKHVMFEADLLCKDGTIYRGEISASIAELDEGDVIQAFVRDITDKKALEAELNRSQKIRAIGTLAGGVAHDFNNLLLPIIGNAQLIAANVDAESKLATFAERIVAAGRRGSRLVVQLLTLGTETEPERTLIDLPYVVHEAVRLIHSILPASVRLTTDIDDVCGGVRANADQVHQIIMNLAINAIHAMEGKEGALHIALCPVEIESGSPRRSEDPGARPFAQLSIADTGCGMDEETRSQIFDPFFTTRVEGKGAGLGLSTVQDILVKHRGSVTVTSKPGLGSTFKILLPRIEPPAGEPGASEPGANEPAAPSRNQHILVVDDDVENTIMMADMLEQIGYRVSTTNGGLAALGLIRTADAKPDLLITDYAMPDMNGDDLIRQVYNELPNLPTIIMTGFEAPLAERRKELAEGAGPLPNPTILGKPFSHQDLAQAIRKSLSGGHDDPV